MGGAPLTHPDEIVADKPEPKPEPLAAQEEDALASSPLFDPEPTEPQDAPRAEEEPARPDYAGFTMPTPQAVARSNAQAPKGRLRIDPVKNAASPAASAARRAGRGASGRTAGGAAGGHGPERNAAGAAV